MSPPVSLAIHAHITPDLQRGGNYRGTAIGSRATEAISHFVRKFEQLLATALAFVPSDVRCRTLTRTL